ncbi:MAG: hypothetical protein CME19_23865 [Gemmatimonadetes bacterium]|nr:hypothetical protein [Gemmatimonadota bacterium]
MNRALTLLLLVILGISCKPVPDPIVQQFGESTLELPSTFENWSRIELSEPSANAREFADRAYGSRSPIPIVYGTDGISGFAITFESEFESQRRHNEAVRFVRGTQRVSSNESETVSEYDGFFFFETEDPSLMFHMGCHVLFLNVPTTSVSRTSSLRRALQFAERVFELNNLLGTKPLRSFQLDPLSFTPSTEIPIQPGPTRFELELGYIVEDQPTAHVSAQVRWFKAGRGLIVYADSTRVQRGSGNVSFNWEVDLSEGAFSDILVIRAHISHPSVDSQEGITVPTTSLIEPIRYNIARVID